MSIIIIATIQPLKWRSHVRSGVSGNSVLIFLSRMIIVCLILTYPLTAYLYCFYLVVVSFFNNAIYCSNKFIK